MPGATIRVSGTHPVDLGRIVAALQDAMTRAEGNSPSIEFALNADMTSLLLTSGNSVYGLKLAKLFTDPENEMAEAFRFLEQGSALT